MDDPRAEAHRLVDDLDESQLPAALAQLRAERASGGSRRKLSRAESLALVEQVWGPSSEDGCAWARRALGLDEPSHSS